MTYKDFKAIIGDMTYCDYETDNGEYNLRHYERNGCIGTVVYCYKTKINRYSITYLKD